MNLTTRSSIKSIQQTVKDDFGVVIDTDLAKNIRDHAGRNVIVWTPDHFKCVASDMELTITSNRIVWYGATYTAKEWNS